MATTSDRVPLPPELAALLAGTLVERCGMEVLDLGPEGGAGGGRIVATGTPEDVAKDKGSYTGHFLAPMLGAGRAGKG